VATDMKERDEQEGAVAKQGHRQRATKAKQRRTTREAITVVLTDAEGPMSAEAIYKEIRHRRLAPGLKGKTPIATIAAQLSIQGEFERVGRGLYQLAE
jgi:hypothetical protein